MKKILSSNHLQKLLENKFDTMNELQKIHYNEFCRYLLKVKDLDELHSAKVKGITNRLNRIALLHPRPIDEIAYKYQKGYYKGFDQDIIAINIKTLGGIFQSFYKDHMLYSGFENAKNVMFFEQRFQNLMNDARFAFQKNVYVNNRNLTLIIEGLSKIGYLEKQFLQFVLERVTSIATNDESPVIDPSQQYFQMDRLYYYSQGFPIDRSKLLEQSGFNKILEEIVNTGNDKSIKQHRTTQKDSQILQNQDQQKIQEFLNTISEQMEKTSQNISIFMQSLISLRLKYTQMVKASSYLMVSADPNLNTELLELQETLLQMKLIKLQEIKDPSSMLDRTKFLETTKQIALQFFSNPQQRVNEFIDQVIKKDQQIVRNRIPVNSNINKEVMDFGRLISSIGKWVSAQTKQIRRDGIVKTKWRSDILDHSGSDIDKYELDVDRVFKKMYHIFIKYMNQSSSEHLSYIKKADPINSVGYIKALLDIGLAQKAQQLVKEFELKLVPEKYGKDHIFALIELSSTFPELKELKQINNQLVQIIEGYLKQNKFLEFKFKINEGGEGWGIYELCTIINWLENTNQQNTPVYNSLVSLLKQQAQNISSPKTHSCYGMIESILNNGNHVKGSCYDTSKYYNPITQFVKQKIVKFYGATYNQNEELVPCGFTDVQSGKYQFLVFPNSFFTSLSGKVINCNLKAHYRRIQKFRNTKVSVIPFMSVVDYNSSIEEFSMKSPSQLKVILDVAKPKQLVELSKYLGELSKSVVDEYNKYASPMFRDEKALQKFMLTLQQIRNYITKQGLINNQNLALINRQKIIYTLIRLQKQLSYFSEDFTKTFSTLSQQLESFIQKVFPNIQTKSNENHPIFSGKRQTIDILGPSTTTSKTDILSQQVLDFDYINNQRYNQYDDWREEFQRELGVYNCAEISIEDCSNLTKLILHNKRTLNVPVLRPRKIVSPPYVYNWDKIYKQATTSETKEAVEVERLMKHKIQQVTPQIQMKVALQNFKYELKYKPKQYIVDLLTSFDFIQELIDEHLKPQQNNYQKLLSRNPKHYFEYLQEKSKDTLLESPYISYILEKVGKREKLRELLIFEKNKARQYLNQARLNEITISQYNEKREKLHKVVMKQIQNYKQQILDEQYTILKDNNKNILKPTINQQEFGRLLKQTRLYSSSQDSDVIISNGDYQQALYLKRHKAEQKLIKLRIIAKISKKDDLNKKQKQYLKLWRKNTSQGMLKETSKNNFTSRIVETLSKEDKEKLNGFVHSSIPTQHPTLRLTQVILEIGHFFDDIAIQDFQAKLLSDSYFQKYKLPRNFFSIYHNKDTSYYLRQLQKAKFDQQCQLNATDIKNIIDISKFMKVEDPNKKKYYEYVYSDIQNSLEELNLFPNRNHSITEWYRLKQEQFDHSINTNEVKFRKGQEVEKVWNELVGKSIRDTTSIELSGLIHTLCERLFIFKRSPPPFMSNLVTEILCHPQLRHADRNILLGSLQLSRFPLTTDSDDIIRLSKATMQRSGSVESIKKKIHEVNGSRLNGDAAAYLYV